MNSKTIQEISNFLECYIVVYDGELHASIKFPDNVVLDDEGNIDFLIGSFDDSLNIESLYSFFNIKDIMEKEGTLIIPDIKRDDLVFAWNDENDCWFPIVGKYFAPNETGHYIYQDNLSYTSHYAHVARFDQLLSGLTIKQLKKKMGMK